MRKLWTILILGQLIGCASTDPSGQKGSSAENSLAAGGSAGKSGVQLPASSVTLFAGGAAYVEHKGTARDDAAIELRVKASQVPGVLKSLVVMDGPDARPAATVQPVEPSGQSTPSGRVDLSQNPTLVDMLQQFRGSAVRVQSGRGVVEGTLISLEKKSDKGDWQINLLTKDGIRAVPIDSMQRIELADARAQAELNKAIASIWQTNGNGDEERRSILVRLSGKGERPVSIGYATDAKPWKTGYRLILGDKPMLQAWATVTNDMDFDWKNVQLVLQSGRPLVLAPDASPDAATVLRAAKTAGVPTGESLRRPRPVPTRPIDLPPGAANPSTSSIVAPPAPSPEGPLVDAREVFRHTIADVSVPKKGTLILPVLSEPVIVERVAVFNELLLKRNPLMGARIQNTTRHYLLQGTLSVLEASQYAGDAVLENLAPGRSAVVTWGIDVPVVVDASEESTTSAITGGAVKEGLLETQRKHTLAKRYVIENETREDQTLLIEHPIRRAWTLAEPARPLETTETVYRFRVPAPSGQRVSFIVKEEATEVETLDLATADADSIQSTLREPSLGAEVRATLEKAQSIRKQSLDLEKAAQTKQSDYDKLIAEQARTRENLKALADSDALRPKLTEKLDQQDKQLADLKQAVEQAQKECERAREGCEREIRKLGK